MGIAAGLGSAITWAVASTFLGSQTAKIDAVTLVLIRAIFAFPLFIVVLFAIGAEDDLWNMPWNNMWQLAWAGFFATGSGDLLFAAAFFLIGMTRALTIVMSLNVLFAFVLASIFLGDDPTLEIAIGSVLILSGVYTVALYGQPRGAGSLATGTLTTESEPVVATTTEAAATKRPIAGGALPDPSAEPPQRSWLLRYRLAIGILAAAGLTGLLLRYRANTQPPEPARHHSAVPSQPVSLRYPQNPPPLPLASFAPDEHPLSTPTQPPMGRRAVIFGWVLAHRQPIGIAVAALAGLNWAIAIVWLRGASFDVDPVAGVTVRIPLVVAIFTIAAIAYPNSSIRKHTITWRGFGAMAISGVVGTGAASVLMLISIQEIGAGEATALLSTGPLWGLPLAVVFLRERITRWAVVGTIVAVTGIMLIA
jgi:drug/metabolite transporter (DMT)-like permease